jgi:hypothetical protein
MLLRFDALDFDSKFDGIWACASLLHVARQDLNAVLARLTNEARQAFQDLGNHELLEAHPGAYVKSPRVELKDTNPKPSSLP